MLLIPTELEAAYIRDQLQLDSSTRIELCGCGPFLAGARTMQLLCQLRPKSVVLIGIAGSLNTAGNSADSHASERHRVEPSNVEPIGVKQPIVEPLHIGSAYEFTEVACFGFGAGVGRDYRSAWELSWQEWTAPEELVLHERIKLVASTESPSRLLLTSSIASGKAEDAVERRSRIPEAVAEDMEGYSVALACQLANVPLRIIRGISNRAGDRQHANWKVASAMQAATDLWKRSS